MTNRVPLLKSEAGIQHDWVDNEDGSYTVEAVFDCEPVLDLNKAMATANDGYSPTRELRRAAHIPFIVWFKWLNEEGWDAFDPRNQKLLFRKLNSSDWAYLRTAPGHL